jgi:hypothetical protein
MDPANDDPLVRKYASGKINAREWLVLNLEKRAIGEMSRERSVELVDRLYKMGAKMIWVADLKKGGSGYESAEILIVELPEDIRQRKKIFGWFIKHTIESGFDPEQDRGQAHIADWFP